MLLASFDLIECLSPVEKKVPTASASKMLGNWYNSFRNIKTGGGGGGGGGDSEVGSGSVSRELGCHEY